MKKARLVWGCFLVLAEALLSWSGTCAAAEFRADQIREEEGGGGSRLSGRIYVTDHKIRLELRAQGQEMVTLVDRVQKKAYLVRPKARVYLEKPIGAAQAAILMPPEALAGIGRVEKLGEEELDGFACQNYRVVYHNPQNGEALIWRSEQLGFPLKVVSRSPRGAVTTRYTNITIEDLDQTLFDLPPEYRQMVPRSAPVNDSQ